VLFTRIIVVATAICVGGLSSSLVLCLTACTEPVTTTSPSHCHEGTAKPTIGVNTGDCRHSPSLTTSPDLSRDERTSVVFAQTATVRSVFFPKFERTAYPTTSITLTRPVPAPTILRI
jgi:hypothetical protein